MGFIFTKNCSTSGSLLQEVAFNSVSGEYLSKALPIYFNKCFIECYNAILLIAESAVELLIWSGKPLSLYSETWLGVVIIMKVFHAAWVAFSLGQGILRTMENAARWTLSVISSGIVSICRSVLQLRYAGRRNAGINYLHSVFNWQCSDLHKGMF